MGEIEDNIVIDTSVQKNNGEIYSGRAVELDGVADRVLDGLDLGTTVTRVLLLVRRDTTGTFRFQLQAGVLSSLAITKAGVWQELEWTGSRTANSVTFGWDGSTYTDCQVADIRLYNGETLVARYLCNEHADTEGTGLNGLPCLDSSGNGHHGSYVGCTGVAGIGVPEELRGLREYEDYMWFDGLGGSSQGVFVSGVMPFDMSQSFDIQARVYQVKRGGSNDGCILLSNSFNRGALLYSNSFGGVFRLVGTSPTVSWGSPFSAPRWLDIRVTHDADLEQAELFLDGVSQGTRTYVGGSGTLTVGKILGNSSLSWSGLITDLRINGTLIATGKGITSAAWGGGTVNGNPLTVGELRRTPPQVAGMGWNTGFENRTTWSNDLTKRNTSGNVLVLDAKTVEFIQGSEHWAKVNFTSAVAAGRVTLRITARSSMGIRFRLNFFRSGSDIGSGDFVTTPDWVTYQHHIFHTGTVTPSIRRANDAPWIGALEVKDAHVFLDGISANFTQTQGFRILPTQLIPATLSSPSLDALGNPIAIPHPNPSVLNHFPTDYTFISNPGPVRSITFFAYNQGQTVKLANLGTPEIGLAANAVTTSGITAPQVYVDTTETATVPPGWHMITIQSTTPFGTTDWELQSTTGNLISYNQEPLSIAKITRNFNSLKRKYKI